MMTRVLLVDDDTELTALLSEYLGQEGFDVERAVDGEAGVRAALDRSPDLVILDVMMPGMSGFEALRRIREQSTVPVILLTARGQDVDRIVGLEMGADDYLAKPFNPRELVARIRAVRRRERMAGSPPSVREVGDLRLDPGARLVTVGGRRLELTGTEFSLLERLIREAGQVVRRETLIREVLGRRPAPFDRSLDVHLSNLRHKLGPRPEGGERIMSVRGVGYQYLRPES